VRAWLVLLAIAAPAQAQPTACDPCNRGDALIDKLSAGAVRSVAGALAQPLVEPLAPEQYARLVELRTKSPALVRLGALDDAQLTDVASALCRMPLGPCVDATAHALRCLADRCEVDLPHADPKRADLVELPPAGCQPSSGTHRRSSALGVGADWGNGWQRSRYPADGSASSLGIEARLTLGDRIGAVARLDRVTGRDEAIDTENNGHDAVATGPITRITALAGPSFVFDNKSYEGTTRFLRLDLLGGYMSTRTQVDEHGVAAGFDLAYQVWALRLGVRVVQGFAVARDATMVLGHIGFVAGGSPPYDYDPDCGGPIPEHTSRLALGIDIPLIGYGISSELGYIAPGLGFEVLWHLSNRFDALVRADLLLYPGYNRERMLHQAALAGLRFDHGRRRHSHTRFFTTLAGGYSVGAGLTPTTVGSGPIVDLSLGWGLRENEAGGYFRLHLRAGVGPDNQDYRAIFISGGGEVHFDPHSWRDPS
jgi:hypothetical protein